ncbi:hypothetical protein GCM10009096_19260 [Parasphingorhabdus litoris]|uniref:Helix-turn-helix domain-containing protein n=1 Tax=Parasphingorhabdus litoris TaxID=394733 RepID=A0ABN1AJF1_9SPHN
MTKKLLTVRQFCYLYGIGRTTFYAEVKQGRIPILKIGKATRVAREDAEKWVENLREAQ